MRVLALVIRWSIHSLDGKEWSFGVKLFEKYAAVTGEGGEQCQKNY